MSRKEVLTILPICFLLAVGTLVWYGIVITFSLSVIVILAFLMEALGNLPATVIMFLMLFLWLQLPEKAKKCAFRCLPYNW